MGRACSENGEKRNAYRLLVEEPEQTRQLGRPKQVGGRIIVGWIS
jgi:hypothetical protein